MENKKNHTELQLSFLEHFLTRSLFLGLSRGFHLSSGWKGAPFASPLTANTTYRPRSSPFHMLEMDRQAACKEDKQTYSLNPIQLSLGTHKAWESKQSPLTADYIHVLSTLFFFIVLRSLEEQIILNKCFPYQSYF